MSNLSDFLKCEKVRCIESNKSHGLKKGEIYDVISTEYTKLGFGEWLHIRISKNGEKNSYLSGFFEPVLETAIQATNALDDTPMGTRTVNEPVFEVGNPVYIFGRPYVSKVRELYNSVIKVDESAVGYKYEQVTLATPENYEMLCKLYPHIEFEAPERELTGSDLCRAMLDKGWKYVVCQVGNHVGVYSHYDESGHIFEVSGCGSFDVTPINPKTGQVLTSEVLDDL